MDRFSTNALCCSLAAADKPGEPAKLLALGLFVLDSVWLESKHTTESGLTWWKQTNFLLLTQQINTENMENSNTLSVLMRWEASNSLQQIIFGDILTYFKSQLVCFQSSVWLWQRDSFLDALTLMSSNCDNASSLSVSCPCRIAGASSCE